MKRKIKQIIIEEEQNEEINVADLKKQPENEEMSRFFEIIEEEEKEKDEPHLLKLPDEEATELDEETEAEAEQVEVDLKVEVERPEEERSSFVKAPKRKKQKRKKEASLDLLALYEDSEKYMCTLETLKETLNKYGVAILPSVLNEEDCQKMMDGMWDFLENATKKLEIPMDPKKATKKLEIPMDRKNPSTWKQMVHLWPLHNMLIKQFGIGQCQMLWNVRQNPKVGQGFTKIWDAPMEDLLT